MVASRESRCVVRLTEPLAPARPTVHCALARWKTRDAVPMLVEKALNGEIKLEHFITHTFSGVGATSKAIEALHSGDCLRAVVTY